MKNIFDSIGDMMKLCPQILFVIGYFLGGWAVMWLLVMQMKLGDPKFAEAIGFYYKLWIGLYLPVAVMAVVALSTMKQSTGIRTIASMIGLISVLSAMFVSFYLDTHWYVLLAEYVAFGAGFRLLAKIKGNTEGSPSPSGAG